MTKLASLKWHGVEYLPIPGCDGYFAGEDGSIVSCWVQKGRDSGRGTDWVLSDEPHQIFPSSDSRGRQRIEINQNGQRRKHFVHRLVLAAFVGPCPDGCECCHFDGNAGNNNLRNLRWDTKLANHADRHRHGTVPRGEGHKRCRVTDAQVLEIRDMAAAGIRQRDIASRLGISQTQVGRIVRNESRKHIQTPCRCG